MEPQKINISYRKIEDYRILHVDGAIGGLTPRGYINLEFFSERGAIPRVMSHEINSGKLGPGKRVEGMEGILRVIHAGVILDLQAAQSLKELLERQIANLSEALVKKEGDAE